MCLPLLAEMLGTCLARPGSGRTGSWRSAHFVAPPYGQAHVPEFKSESGINHAATQLQDDLRNPCKEDLNAEHLASVRL